MWVNAVCSAIGPSSTLMIRWTRNIDDLRSVLRMSAICGNRLADIEARFNTATWLSLNSPIRSFSDLMPQFPRVRDGGETMVPRPGLRSINPSPTSIRIASRIVCRLTLNSDSSSISGGSNSSFG